MAVFHATVKQGADSSGAWLALPIHGPSVLRVQARPAHAREGVDRRRHLWAYHRLGQRRGPRAGEDPSRSHERAGDDSECSGKPRTQTVPSPPPVLPRPARGPGASDPGAARPVAGLRRGHSGNPAVALPPLSVSADQGTLGPIEAKEGGVFEVAYTASDRAAPQRPSPRHRSRRPIAPPRSRSSLARRLPPRRRAPAWPMDRLQGWPREHSRRPLSESRGNPRSACSCFFTAMPRTRVAEASGSKARCGSQSCPGRRCCRSISKATRRCASRSRPQGPTG